MLTALLLSTALAQATPMPSPIPTATPIPVSAYFTPPDDMSITLAPKQLSETERLLFVSVLKSASMIPESTLYLITERVSIPTARDTIGSDVLARIRRATPGITDSHWERVPICGGKHYGIHNWFTSLVQGKKFAFDSVIAVSEASDETLTYVRPVSDAADPKIVASLMTLCPHPY